MCMEKTFRQFSDSQNQLKAFMEAVDETDDMAQVTVRQNGGLVYSDKCEVFEKIETNYSHVDIIWNDKNDSEFPYYCTYRNDYQEFKSFGNILIINAKDKKGNVIEIEIRKCQKS